MNTTIAMSSAVFGWSDYTVFFLMLGVSMGIGIYFGCFGNKQKSVNDYLLGGNGMNPIAVAISIVASTISGFSLIAIPAEIYSEGATYCLVIMSMVVSCIISHYLFIPVFYDLKVSSAYEYLELRFNKQIRTIASCLFFITALLFLPTVVYIPSLTLNQVTGINLHIISFGVTFVCVFYTLIGGFKAVVWTDFLQMIVTFIGCIIIIIIGTINAGGASFVFKTTYDDGVLNIFNMDPNPFQRTTFWTVFSGCILTMTSIMGTSQTNVQRYLSLPSRNDISKVLIIYLIGYSTIILICTYSGLLLYAAYYGCDPVQQKLVERTDKIFPYYIMDKIGYVPILPGLFVAGVFSAGLSTLSTGLNTMAAIIYEDYLKLRGVDDNKSQIIMKCAIAAIGIFSVLMIVVIERMGNILSVSFVITSITNAPVLAIFILGMMVPTANSKGAIAAAISSAAALTWLAIGSTLSKVNFNTSSIYPEGVDTCPSNSSVTTLVTKIAEIDIPKSDDVFILYKLSFMHYFNFGIIVAIIVGVATSYITGKTDPATLDPRVISPPLRRFLPEKKTHDTQEMPMIIN